MNVWFALPSIRPAKEVECCVRAWRSLDYRVALLRQGWPVECDLAMPTERYLGYPRSINLLVKAILTADPRAEWIVIGGDDLYPDNRYSAYEIGLLFRTLFGGQTLAVVQPTGDRRGGGYIDTAAASAWIGREFCERAYAGSGPLWDSYYHYYSDAELQVVATQMGCFLQRRDIIHHHNNWALSNNPVTPEFLVTPLNLLNRDLEIFKGRQAAGFPGFQL